MAGSGTDFCSFPLQVIRMEKIGLKDIELVIGHNTKQLVLSVGDIQPIAMGNCQLSNDFIHTYCS